MSDLITSGNRLYGRRFRLTIANPVSTPGDFKNVTTDIIEVDGTRDGERALRVQFEIEKSLEKQPNSSKLKVTNLSESMRHNLSKKGVKVLFEAGYKSSGLFRLFVGDVRTIDNVRQDADWETTMQLGDGDRAWKYARVNESFAAGARGGDVLMELAKATGLDLGNIEKQAKLIRTVVDQGYSATGNALRALDTFVSKVLKKTISIQDGELQLLDVFEVLDHPIPEVSPETGLVGSPEMQTPPAKGKPQLLRFKCLLQPFKPGAKVRLISDRYDGHVRIQKVKYEGDTSGADVAYYSSCDCILLKG